MSKSKRQQIGPSGYLVVLRHTMDDLPLAFITDESEAILFAGKVKPMPTEKIRKVFQTDCSTPICVAVWQFIDGLPVGQVGSYDL